MSKLAQKIKPVILYDVKRYLQNVYIDGPDSKEYKPVVGEDESCLCVLAGFILMRVSTIIEAYSGTGKSMIVNAITSLLDPRLCFEMQCGSEKSIWDSEYDINRATYIILTELQKATGGDIEEVLKDWGERKNATYRRTDITMDKDGDQVRKKLLNWKPFLTTRALENEKCEIGHELGRRVALFRTNPTQRQTEEIVEYKLKVEQVGHSKLRTMTEAEIDVLKAHIDNCLKNVPKEIRTPFAPLLLSSSPTIFTIARSYIDYLMMIIKGVAIFNMERRIIDKDGILYVTPEDLYQAWEIYGDTYTENCLKLPILGRESLKIFPKTTGDCDENGTPPDVECLTEHNFQEQLKERGIMLEGGAVRDILSKLNNAGFIETNREIKKPGERTKYWKSSFVENLKRGIDWGALRTYTVEVVKREYPEIAEEYIASFLQDGQEVIHPITGETIQIFKQAPPTEETKDGWKMVNKGALEKTMQSTNKNIFTFQAAPEPAQEEAKKIEEEYGLDQL